MTTISLKSLLVPSKSVEVEYPGMPDFKLNISFMSREVMLNIRKKATKTTFKGRQTTDELDEALFTELYTKHTVTGWTGLKFKYLELLAPVDIAGQDPEAELLYTEENALFLVKNSGVFDQFITDQVSDLGNFTTSK